MLKPFIALRSFALYVETISNGIIKPKQGKNTRIPYDHQKEAMAALTRLDEEKGTYSGLIVLPIFGMKTGGL